jgi:hypothetical protein
MLAIVGCAAVETGGKTVPKFPVSPLLSLSLSPEE